MILLSLKYENLILDQVYNCFMKAEIKDTSKPYEREQMPWLWYHIISSIFLKKKKESFELFQPCQPKRLEF